MRHTVWVAGHRIRRMLGICATLSSRMSEWTAQGVGPLAICSRLPVSAALQRHESKLSEELTTTHVIRAYGPL